MESPGYVIAVDGGGYLVDHDYHPTLGSARASLRGVEGEQVYALTPVEIMETEQDERASRAAEMRVNMAEHWGTPDTD